jgi:peptidoglycan/LPS O-acetylase OafA/YrhL
MALDSQAFAQGHSLWEIVTNILFLQSFGLHPAPSWNGTAWSAALEFYVSILFAAIVLLFPRRRYDIFFGLCLAAGLLLYMVSPHTLFVSVDWGILRAIFSFFAGGLVYDWRVRSSGWHYNEKLMLLGTPGQALLPALILSVVLVVPIAALSYRWIQKPAMDAARLRIANPVTWLGAVSATSDVVAILRQHAKSLIFSAGCSIPHGLDAVAAMSRRRDTGIRM